MRVSNNKKSRLKDLFVPQVKESPGKTNFQVKLNIKDEEENLNDTKFRKSQLYSILKNKEAHRTEKEMEDVVYILMKLDFIREREGEQKFDPKDLTEMAKSVELLEIEAG